MMMAEQFFGGVEALRKTLADALARARREKGMSWAELDAICGFGVNDLPSSRTYELDPSRVTSTVVSRAMFPLELTVDSVLMVEWGEGDERLDFVKGLMEAEGAGIAATAGGTNPATIPFEDQARVYVIVRALDELDAAPACVA